MLCGKESACNVRDTGDLGFIPGSGRSPGQGHGKPLHYFCLENPMDRRVWRATVHGVAQSRTRLKQLSTHACRVIRELAFLLCSPLYADSVKEKLTICNKEEGCSHQTLNQLAAGSWMFTSRTVRNNLLLFISMPI